MLPELFLTRMKKLLKEEYKQFLSALEKAPVRSFQINQTKVKKEEFLSIFPYSIEKISSLQNGFYLLESIKVGSHLLHHAGAFYMQEAAAMMVGNTVSIAPHSKVLDVCAAPGGKTITIHNQLQNTGVIVSNEIIPARSKVLRSNIERMGIQNAIITNMDSETLSKFYRGTFDYVFVDTPCSGEGMFRKSGVAITDWSLTNIESCQKRDLEILENASKCLKENGYLIYSTCTYAKEENEDVIALFLKHHSYEICEITESIRKVASSGLLTNVDTKKALRFYPHIFKGEGQFVCVLKKKEDEEKIIFKNEVQDISSCNKDLIDSFLEDTLVTISFTPKMYKNNIIACPNENVPVPPYQVVSAFVKIGEIQGNRIVPHHQFFSAYGKLFKNQVNLSLDDKKLSQYSRGEQIHINSVRNGYGVILVEGIPLGGFKAKDGKLNNHYPKGLRNN